MDKILIEDWKQSYKYFSVVIAAVLAILGALQATLPQMKAVLTPETYAAVTSVIGVLVIAGRLLQQPLLGNLFDAVLAVLSKQPATQATDTPADPK